MPNPVRTLLGSASGLAHARLALFGAELREELERIAFLVLGGCTAIVLAALTLGAASAAVILAIGEGYRVAVAAALAAVFASGIAYAVVRLHRTLSANRVPFADSLAEMQLDHAALIERSHEDRSALLDSGAELMRLVSIGMLAYSIGKRLRRAA